MPKTWIKIWVNEHLTGTTRYELTPEQRSVWIDMLVLAGANRYQPSIAIGKIDGEIRGFSEDYFAVTLNISRELLTGTLNACVRSGKISTTTDSKGGIIVTITNWKKYQSEYSRQKQYRLQPKLQPELRGEGEGEGEKKEKESKFDLFSSLPDFMKYPEREEAWRNWVEYRKDIRKPIRKKSFEMMMKIFEKNEDAIVSMIETSIASGWQGLFPPKKSKAQTDFVHYQNLKVGPGRPGPFHPFDCPPK